MKDRFLHTSAPVRTSFRKKSKQPVPFDSHILRKLVTSYVYYQFQLLFAYKKVNSKSARSSSHSAGPNFPQALSFLLPNPPFSFSNEDKLSHLSRLRALKHSGASTWLTTIPTNSLTRLSNDHIACAVRLRLGLQPYTPLPHFCFACSNSRSSRHSAAFDKNPYHHLCCPKFAGTFLTMRHDRIKYIIAQYAREAGIPTIVEPKGLDPLSKKRVDLQLFTPSTGSSLLVDISIVHPTAPSYSSLASGRAADLRAQHKINKHHSASSSSPVLPVVIESYGGFHSSCYPLFARIREGLMTSLASSSSASVKYSEFLSSLSIALQSANSQAIIGGRQLNLHRAAFNIVSQAA